MIIKGFDSLPNRRFFDADNPLREEFVDAHGFLSTKGVEITQGIDELLNLPLALVIAPPWYGKTFTAQRLNGALRLDAENKNPSFLFGKYFHGTFFHQFGNDSGVEPQWWQDWQNEEGQRACWIVDAIDEDIQNHKVIFGILEKIKKLTPENRSQLTLLLFCRENELHDDLRDILNNMSGSEQLNIHMLAPLDEQAALELTESKQKLSIIKQLITQNKLGRLGGYPAVIKQLAKYSPNEEISRKQLWRDVLQWRLRGGHRERDDNTLGSDKTDRFDAASRAAAVSLFAGLSEFDTGSGKSSSRVTINDLFSKDVLRFDQLRDASHFLRHTDILSSTATGYRFAERHVQEWFAAFALQNVKLNRLRPLLSSNDEPFLQFRGVTSILSEITDHDNVRNWIMNIYSGFPPQSDTLPFEFQDVVIRLDHLEKLANRSPYGLTYWDKPSLENLNVRGIGNELSRRLKDPKRNIHQKKLLLNVAVDARATKILPIVEQIIRDTKQNDGLRSDASYALLRLGGKEHFTKMVSFVQKEEPTSREQRVVIANIVRGLLKHDIWGFREAYPCAPSGDQGIGDASSTVEYELRNMMSLDDARWLLDNFDWDSHSGQRGSASKRVYHKFHGESSFARHAVEMLLKEDILDEKDWTLLHAVAFARDEGFVYTDLVDKIINKAKVETDSRRRLFKAGIRSDPTGKHDLCWQWRIVLTIDDIDWLSQLAATEGDTIPWLWEYLLRLAYDDNVEPTTKEEIRALVKSVKTDLLTDFDQQFAKNIKIHQQWQKEQEKIQKEHDQQQVQLEDVVKKILTAEKPTPIQVLHNLSWVCFSGDSYRPNNIIGHFEDLIPELQKTILIKCTDALMSSDPTPIPDGNSIPSTIIYEDQAFAAVLKQIPDYQLSTDQILKWLPSTLVFSIPNKDSILTRCYEADRTATEDVLIDAFRREIRSKDSGSHTAINLPVEYWSDRLIQKTIKLVHDETLPVAGRCSLLRVIAARSPKRAETVAHKWVKTIEGTPDDKKSKRLAAVDALLCSGPEIGVTELTRVVEDFGNDVIETIESLSRHRSEETVSFTSWPVSALEQLAHLLYKICPVSSDPKEVLGEPRWVGPGDELRTRRDSFRHILFNRGGPEEINALERLSRKIPSVKKWYAWAQANKDAAEIIKTKSVIEGTVQWKDVVRLLDDTKFRLIRSPADLQSVLMEQLAEIAKTAKEHLQMLYCRHKSSKTGKRKHLPEEALQTYIYARLADRLPMCVDKKVVFLDRETQEASRRRLDIKVQTTTIEGKSAIVVIEIKWSDNNEQATSLRDQLGKNYLININLTHGIYLVGWMGEGAGSKKKGAAIPEDRNSPIDWEKAFQDQAESFNSDHSEIKIEPIVIDLCWDNDAKIPL